MSVSANAYCIIPDAPITIPRRHEPGRLYRGTEGRVRLDRPRSGVRLRRVVSPGPLLHEDEDGRGFAQV